ncbi:MAG: hypothetical protein ND895_24240 [Pyrinomonadaceae bacterium]|nr:hypothetical protein [Pyrinomonadaceae bacterium]
MKIASPYLIILTLSWYVLACSSPKIIEQTKPFPVGDYQYAGYIKGGGKIVEGQLSITSVESRRIQSGEQIQIKGNWQLSKVGNPEKIGPQVGSGELTGSIIKGEIYIDLNPNISDSNVILKGTIEGKRFHGTWSFNGYAGAINQGTFEATRK